MAHKPNRYRIMERYMTYALCLDTVLFVLYMIAAGNGIIWLKVILTLLCLALSGALLWFLYVTRELLRQRSLWITTGACAIVLCLFFSLILNFPSPNKYKQPDAQKDSAYQTIQSKPPAKPGA